MKPSRARRKPLQIELNWSSWAERTPPPEFFPPQPPVVGHFPGSGLYVHVDGFIY